LRRVLKEWQKQISSLASTISTTKELILLLDTQEELGDLSLEEWNFRHILKQHLESFRQHQNTYWKQRGTIKWVRFGNECTSFFNASATIKHKRNATTSLTYSFRSILTSHEDKASVLWNSIKERLGVSE
jgi:hypothetical protein